MVEVTANTIRIVTKNNRSKGRIYWADVMLVLSPKKKGIGSNDCKLLTYSYIKCFQSRI